MSFIRWVKGTASKDEIRKWDRWISESREHQIMAARAQELVLGVDFQKQTRPDTRREWNKLQQRIDHTGPESKPPAAHNFHRRKTLPALKVAAGLLIAGIVGLFSMFMYQRAQKTEQSEQKVEWNQIATEYRQQKTIALSDGSTIQLNANSSITYPAGWVRGNVTKVYLEGEAYFSIRKRESQHEPPFEVITKDGSVKVLGTKFVVDTDSLQTRVALEEGEIAIVTGSPEDVENGGEAYHLTPNKLATFNGETASLEVTEITDIRLYTSWTDNKLILDSTPLRYLVHKIRDIYGVDVEVSNKDLFNRKLTGTIQLKSLDYLIQSVSGVIDEQVYMENGTVYFGSFN
ncbi:MAG: FecR domain-containing protein [Balneolaceae bacterium]|nr:FecR domain-containing protein [Balneolaceae bacterium]